MSVHNELPWRVEKIDDALGYHVVDGLGTEADVGVGSIEWFTHDAKRAERIAGLLNTIPAAA